MKNEQYFTNNPTSKDEHLQFEVDIAGQTFKFNSNNGVFSKNYLDFGTKVLLETVDKLKLAPKEILDLGVGYGPIAIFMGASYPNAQVLGTDVNERALLLAEQNIDLNGLQNIKIKETSVYEGIDKKFDLILSNPPIRAGKKIVSAIVEGSYEHLNDQGQLIVVIQKKQGAPSLKKEIMQVFGNCRVLKREKGYYILAGQKLSDE